MQSPPEKPTTGKKRGGIPYTSTGCTNCKNHKIKYDLAKPQYAKCIKKGIPCSGYEKNRNFLHYTVVSQSESNRPTKKQLIRQHVSKSPPMPAKINMSGMVRTQLFATFMDTFFALNSTSLDSDSDSFYLLINRFPTFLSQSELLDHTVIALASLFLGKTTGDNGLEHHGAEIYNQGINMMVRMLQRENLPILDVLYTGIIFHTYETMRGSEDGFRNCYTHVQGATAIIKHYHYKTCNHEDKSLMKAILSRQKWTVCFYLTNTQYGSEVDWECLTVGLEDNPFDQLFGAFAECAILQRDLNQIVERNAVDMDDLCEAILQRCYAHEERMLLDLPAADRHPFPCHRDKLSYESNALPLDPDVDPYEYQHLATAKIYVLYWVALAATRKVIYRAEKLLSLEANPTRLLFYAQEICRSMAYCLQPSTHMSTGHVIIFAMSQASKCFVDCEDREQFMWCQGIFPLVSSRGFEVASHCSEVERKYWNASQGQSIIYRLPVAYDNDYR